MGTPIDVYVIGLLAGGFLLGGFFGSTLALRLDKEMLKKVFAVILFYTAFKMLDWDQVVIRFFKKVF